MISEGAAVDNSDICELTEYMIGQWIVYGLDPPFPQPTFYGYLLEILEDDFFVEDEVRCKLG